MTSGAAPRRESNVTRIARALRRRALEVGAAATSYARGEPVGTIALLGSTVELADVLQALQMLHAGDDALERYVVQLERLFANHLGTPHAYSFSSGRVALSAILEAMDIGAGDEVIIPGFTCVAVPNALLFAGIRPVYADIDLQTFDIPPEAIDQNVSRRTRAILIQHTFGLVSNLGPLLAAAERRGLRVIEDCAHALGAMYQGRRVGTFGHAAFFSMEQSKVISTQMGGMAVTNDNALALRIASIQERAPFPPPEEIEQRLRQFAALYLRSRPQWAAVLEPVLGPAVDRYLQPGEGLASTTEDELRSIQPPDYGKRLPGALASLGIRQLQHLDRYNQRRLKSAQLYEERLAAMGASRVTPTPRTNPVFLRYPVFVRDKAAFAEVAGKIGLQPGMWFTDNIHPHGTDLHRLRYERGQCPSAEWAARFVANLPTGFELPRRVLDRLDLLDGILSKQTPGGD